MYEEEGSYQSYDDADSAAEPASSFCTGDGDPMCHSTCQIWKRPDCRSCMCILCPFCTNPDVEESPPPPPPPPAPAPPPTPFTCDMLRGRKNLKDEGVLWCYVVASPEECDHAFTYEKDGADGPDLRLCSSRTDGSCDHALVQPPAQYASPECQRYLVPPPPSPRQPPPPSPPPSPSLPQPSPPPAPPAPPPCLQLSAICGGAGWTGETNCCQSPGAKATCVKRNEHQSRCRVDCPEDWDCSEQNLDASSKGPKRTSPGEDEAPDAAGPSPPPPSPPSESGPKRTSPGEDEAPDAAGPSPPPPSPPSESPSPSPSLPPPSPTVGEERQEHGKTELDGATNAGARVPNGPVAQAGLSAGETSHASKLVGLVLGTGVATLAALCVACMCRRWYTRGRARRRGSKLKDNALTDASDFEPETELEGHELQGLTPTHLVI